MNKCALYIPRPGSTSAMIAQGYVDALRHLGWKVYVTDPKTKLGCCRLIEEYGVRFIMSNSRYGIRQLPIQLINGMNIPVAIQALPLNKDNTTVDDCYEFAHKDEPNILREIDNLLVHTYLEPNVWDMYMSGWSQKDIDLKFLPVAGNLVKAMPPTCSILTDVAMVANFKHRQDILKILIEPLFKRIDMLGYSYQAFGDEVWQTAGLNCNGPLTNDAVQLAHIYATAKVCPNVHTQQQVINQTHLNERSFMIPLCGGIQVLDNPLAKKYLEGHCEIASSTTDFMNKVIGLVEKQPNRVEKIKNNVEHVSKNHTYFNRLSSLFKMLGLNELGDEVESHGQREAIKHCWGIDARLSSEQRGVPYEQQTIVAS